MNFQTILDPPILFFCLGVLSVWFKSNIEIPSNTTKFLSYYLLVSIGFKGGMALSQTPFSVQMLYTSLAGICMAILIPLWMYLILRLRLDKHNAAATAACYGSVSAVTFVTGISWLENQGLPYSGYMVALIALMDSPAIILGIMLAKFGKQEKNVDDVPVKTSQILHDAIFNGSVFLILGSLAIGYISGQQKQVGFNVFIYDMFKGFLSFFLLDLGITAAKQIKELKGNVLFLSLIAVVAPLFNALIGLGLAKLIGLSPSDGFLFMILCASASYIAVPAALKMCLPKAQTGYYLSLGLGITFPFNLLFGLAFYWSWATHFLA